jgi:hypothetical protein|tara:strand:- start:1403 stop:1849 length:447 start_codon:yes stop_codon:yes gene_type:complete
MIKETLLAGAVILSLGGCSSFLPEVTKYSSEPVERPLLILPESEITEMRGVDYIVVTEENVDEVWRELEASGKPIVLFALTHEGYEALALNNADIIRFLSEQRAVIIAYKEYYEKADKAIGDANDKNKNSEEPEASTLSSIKRFLNTD